jgi:hypothetical protein
MRDERASPGKRPDGLVRAKEGSRSGGIYGLPM